MNVYREKTQCTVQYSTVHQIPKTMLKFHSFMVFTVPSRTMIKIKVSYVYFSFGKKETILHCTVAS